MKTYMDCYPCFLRHALEAARFVGADVTQQYRILQAVLTELRSFELTRLPPEMAQRIHRIVKCETNESDPYLSVKKASTEQALRLYPQLKTLLAESDKPLETATRLSIAGNIIDYGMATQYDLDATIERVLEQPFAIGDLSAFKDALTGTHSSILYLADNAGETVFDRILLEVIDKPVIYVVRGAPILNDATRQDALDAGIDDIAEIADNGSDAPGTILSMCSTDFRRIFSEAELIIAKGQGNYESLSQSNKQIFFLLLAKCPVIARDLQVPVGSIVLKAGATSSTESANFTQGELGTASTTYGLPSLNVSESSIGSGGT